MRSSGIILAAAALIAARAGAVEGQQIDRGRVEVAPSQLRDAPAVQVWLERWTLRSGESIRPILNADEGAYVLVLRVTTNGELKVLYPRRPSQLQPHSAARLAGDRLPMAGEAAFYVNEPPGIGHVFAIASYYPFDLRHVSAGSQWNTRPLGRSPYGDPFIVLQTFISRILPETADYSFDYREYEVRPGGRYATRGAGYGYGYGLSPLDFYNRCVTLLGYRMDLYCRARGYDPYGGVVLRPLTPGPAGPRPKRPPNPLVPDPMIDGDAVIRANRTGGKARAQAQGKPKRVDPSPPVSRPSPKFQDRSPGRADPAAGRSGKAPAATVTRPARDTPARERSAPPARPSGKNAEARVEREAPSRDKQ